MDEWKAELDQLRQQNEELRENTMRLEKQIHQQQYNTGDKLISPITSPSIKSKVIPAPVVVVMDKHTKRKTKNEELPPSILTTFLPVNLRAHDHKVIYGSPTTSCSSSSSIGGLEDTKLYYSHQMSWNTTTGSDFDQYETNIDFMSTNNGNQALDELCGVLQSRQRSEISSPYASMQNQQHQSYAMQLSSPIVRNDSNDMVISRTY